MRRKRTSWRPRPLRKEKRLAQNGTASHQLHSYLVMLELQKCVPMQWRFTIHNSTNPTTGDVPDSRRTNKRPSNPRHNETKKCHHLNSKRLFSFSGHIYSWLLPEPRHVFTSCARRCSRKNVTADPHGVIHVTGEIWTQWPRIQFTSCFHKFNATDKYFSSVLRLDTWRGSLSSLRALGGDCTVH